MPTETTGKPVKHMRDLVISYLRFRIWFHWLDGRKNHMYGQEWSCSLSQVLNRRVPNIELNREAGYIDCLGLAEKYNHRYHTAKIYSGSNQAFNKVHRIYKKGSTEPEEIHDPVFSDDNRILLLSYRIENNSISVERMKDLIALDFKKEIDDKLSKEHR